MIVTFGRLPLASCPALDPCKGRTVVNGPNLKPGFDQDATYATCSPRSNDQTHPSFSNTQILNSLDVSNLHSQLTSTARAVTVIVVGKRACAMCARSGRTTPRSSQLSLFSNGMRWPESDVIVPCTGAIAHLGVGSSGLSRDVATC